MTKKRIIHNIFFFIVLSFQQIIFAQGSDVVKISVKEFPVKVNQGDELKINLEILVDQTWHINSNKPNDDFLIPSEISASGKGIKLINVKYPEAKKIKIAFSKKLILFRIFYCNFID